MKLYNNSDLQCFVKKYYLNGFVANAILHSANGNLSTNFKNESGRLRGQLNLNQIGLPNCFIADYEPGNLLKLLKLFDKNITIDVEGHYIGGFSKSLIIKDNCHEAIYSLAPPDLINSDGKILQVEFDIDMNLSRTTIANFLKLINTQKSSVIGFFENGNQVYAIVETNSSSYVKMKLDAVTNNSIANREINIYTEYFKEIVKQNIKDYENAVLRISSKGVVEISFTKHNLSATYWIVGTVKLNARDAYN